MCPMYVCIICVSHGWVSHVIDIYVWRVYVSHVCPISVTCVSHQYHMCVSWYHMSQSHACHKGITHVVLCMFVSFVCRVGITCVSQEYGFVGTCDAHHDWLRMLLNPCNIMFDWLQIPLDPCNIMFDWLKFQCLALSKIPLVSLYVCMKIAK